MGLFMVCVQDKRSAGFGLLCEACKPGGWVVELWVFSVSHLG